MIIYGHSGLSIISNYTYMHNMHIDMRDHKGNQLINYSIMAVEAIVLSLQSTGTQALLKVSCNSLYLNFFFQNPN